MVRLYFQHYDKTGNLSAVSKLGFSFTYLCDLNTFFLKIPLEFHVLSIYFTVLFTSDDVIILIIHSQDLKQRGVKTILD